MFETYLKTHAYVDSDVAVQLLTKQIARAYTNKAGDDVVTFTAAKRFFEEFNLRMFRSYVQGQEGVEICPATLTIALRDLADHIGRMSFVGKRLRYLTCDAVMSLLAQYCKSGSIRHSTTIFFNTYEVIWTVIK